MKKKSLNRFLILFAFCAFVAACDSQLTDDPIPFVSFPSTTIQLNNPSFSDLNTKGWIYYNNIGVKGVIIYKESETSYHVFERNCSFQPNNACATVDVHSSNLYMQDTCCGSNFSFQDGKPTGGPAWRNLRQYICVLNGTELTITDEIQ